GSTDDNVAPNPFASNWAPERDRWQDHLLVREPRGDTILGRIPLVIECPGGEGMITDGCVSAIPLHHERRLEHRTRHLSINQETDPGNASVIVCKCGDFNGIVSDDSCPRRGHPHN